MRWAVLVVAVVGCAKANDGAPAAAGSAGSAVHEDRHEPAVTASKLKVDVIVAGVRSTWGDAAFAAVPTIVGAANDGEARDTWSLRALVDRHVGAGARVVSITGPDGTKPIDASAWTDATHTPILHTTRRGTLKFRWADQAGAWGDTIVRDVTAIEVAR